VKPGRGELAASVRTPVCRLRKLDVAEKRVSANSKKLDDAELEEIVLRAGDVAAPAEENTSGCWSWAQAEGTIEAAMARTKRMIRVFK
jgi:hypothetical protein